MDRFYEKLVLGDFRGILADLAKEPSEKIADYDYLMGTANLGLGNFEIAKPFLRSAVLKNPEDDAALFNYGKVCLAKHQPTEAVKCFEMIASRNAAYPGIAHALSNALRHDARYEEAIALIDKYFEPQSRVEALMRERAICLTYLGNVSASIAAYDELLEKFPNSARAWFGSHAGAFHIYGIENALQRLNKAIALNPTSGKYRAFQACYLLLLGKVDEAQKIIDRYINRYPVRAHLVHGVLALIPKLSRHSMLMGSSAVTLKWALSQAKVSGLVLEFGVRRGASIRYLAEVADQDVHGFDSFEGIPDAWGAEPIGAYSTHLEIPDVPSNVQLHVGWFDKTLPEYIQATTDPVRFINIDCDIYSSTKTVLNLLAGKILAGTIIVFDELIGNKTWENDEWRALNEFSAQFDKNWEVIAISPYTKQVAIRFID